MVPWSPLAPAGCLSLRSSRPIWLARDAGSVVGGCVLRLPMLDNLHNAEGEILVVPERRRRGIGRALLAHLRAEATRRGRIRLVGAEWQLNL